MVVLYSNVVAFIIICHKHLVTLIIISGISHCQGKWFQLQENIKHRQSYLEGVMHLNSLCSTNLQMRLDSLSRATVGKSVEELALWKNWKFKKIGSFFWTNLQFFFDLLPNLLFACGWIDCLRLFVWGRGVPVRLLVTGSSIRASTHTYGGGNFSLLIEEISGGMLLFIGVLSRPEVRNCVDSCVTLSALDLLLLLFRDLIEQQNGKDSIQ